MSDQPVAITYLDDQKGDEAITYQNNNLEDEETKYICCLYYDNQMQHNTSYSAVKTLPRRVDLMFSEQIVD